MEILEVEKDIAVFGFQVKTFPKGIKDAFDKLIAMVPEGLGRSYYGISYMTAQNDVAYFAAVEEKNENEAEKNNCERYIIGKGTYLTITVKDWLQKTDSISNVFDRLMKEKDADLTKACVEWYKNDDEMLCMIKRLPSQ